MLNQILNQFYLWLEHTDEVFSLLFFSPVNSLTAKVNTAKPVLSGHSKIDIAKFLKTNGSVMKVKSIAECSLGAFCNTFDLH